MPDPAEERRVHRQRDVVLARELAEPLGPRVVHPEARLEVDLAGVVAALEQQSTARSGVSNKHTSNNPNTKYPTQPKRRRVHRQRDVVLAGELAELARPTDTPSRSPTRSRPRRRRSRRLDARARPPARGCPARARARARRGSCPWSGLYGTRAPSVTGWDDRDMSREQLQWLVLGHRPAAGDRRRRRARARRPSRRAAADGDGSRRGGRHRSRCDEPVAAGSRGRRPRRAGRGAPVRPHRAGRAAALGRPRIAPIPGAAPGRPGRLGRVGAPRTQRPHRRERLHREARHRRLGSPGRASGAQRELQRADGLALRGGGRRRRRVVRLLRVGARRGRRRRPRRAPRRDSPGVPAPDRHGVRPASTRWPTCRRRARVALVGRERIVLRVRAVRRRASPEVDRSTTGRTRRASRSSVAVGRPCAPEASCSSWRSCSAGPVTSARRRSPTSTCSSGLEGGNARRTTTARCSSVQGCG